MNVYVDGMAAVHELSVTESLLQIALREAEAAHASRITDLFLVVGDLSTIVDDSVQFYWDIISADTLAQGATLHFERIPAAFHCKDCDHTYTPAPGELLCPLCAQARVEAVDGQQFYLESIEIEE